MLGAGIINHIKGEMPELQDLQVVVGGRKLGTGDYELLNAFLVHNNVLDDAKKSLAIIHPKNDLLDVWLLIIMGLSAYKYSALKNSKLSINDFKKGELVEYNGRILLYNGVYVDPKDKIERFQLVYGDEYVISPTTENIPVKYFPELSKYTGSKTTPDLSTSKRHKKNVKDALQEILNLQKQDTGFSGYPTFLISSESSRLVDLLREVQVNGTPFFDMFPSAKCTSSSKQRLGRDSVKRSFMFYFVSGLSAADDVLKDEPHIRTLFVDARGKALKDGTLLASIRNQYDLEDIYMLQTYNRMDSVGKLGDGLGFKVWIWNSNDFAGMKNQPARKQDGIATDDVAMMVAEHNSIPSRLANYADTPVEVEYPQGITLNQHNLIQDYIRKMFSLSEEYSNEEMRSFSIHAAGVANRIFQSPLSSNDLDKSMEDSGRRSFNEDISFLKDRMKSFSYGLVPDDFKDLANNLLSLIETAATAFKYYYGKCDSAISIIENNPVKKICIFTSPKYPLTTKLVAKVISAKLNAKGHPELLKNVTIAENLLQSTRGYDIAIWTYKPQVKEYFMLEPSIEKNFILLYPLQKREFELVAASNNSRFQQYLQPDYRAGILNVPVEMLNDNVQTGMQPATNEEAFDLEQLLSDTMAKAATYYRDSGNADLVSAKMVLFTDGVHAFFLPGSKIKVVDLENETVETKTVGSLSEGDDVAFLKDSKRTVFEELVEYYQHKPEVIELIKMSELWRTALIEYRDKHFLHPVRIKKSLDEAGLVRHQATIENWLDGSTICPVEDDYAAVDIIARVTKNPKLMENTENVKDAARKIHALRIKIGRYLAKKIIQSFISPGAMIDDPVLQNKLDEISSHIRIVRVLKVSDETVNVPAERTNKLLTEEDV